MLFRLLVLAGLAVCIVVSIVLRMQIEGYRSGDVVASPLSEAVTQLVGFAGGIYVALVLLLGFLEIEVPRQIQVHNISLNPLALVSVLLACVQPMVPIVWQAVKAVCKK